MMNRSNVFAALSNSMEQLQNNILRFIIKFEAIHIYMYVYIYIYVILSIHLYKTLTKSFNSNFGTEFADVNDAGEIKDKQR